MPGNLVCCQTYSPKTVLYKDLGVGALGTWPPSWVQSGKQDRSSRWILAPIWSPSELGGEGWGVGWRALASSLLSSPLSSGNFSLSGAGKTRLFTWSSFRPHHIRSFGVELLISEGLSLRTVVCAVNFQSLFKKSSRIFFSFFFSLEMIFAWFCFKEAVGYRKGLEQKKFLDVGEVQGISSYYMFISKHDVVGEIDPYAFSLLISTLQFFFCICFLEKKFCVFLVYVFFLCECQPSIHF